MWAHYVSRLRCGMADAIDPELLRANHYTGAIAITPKSCHECVKDTSAAS